MYRAPFLLLALSLRVCGRDPTPANAPIVAVAPQPMLGAAPAPTHGGRVQVVGNYAVETVAARTGGVALFWTDLQGNPIAPDQITLPRVRVNVNDHVSDVPVHVVNGAFVANVAVPAMAPVAVTVPHVVVVGVPYEAVEIPSVVVVAAVPGIIIVPVGAPVVAPVLIEFHGKHRKFRGGFGWH
jgi:hypothetical protein